MNTTLTPPPTPSLQEDPPALPPQLAERKRDKLLRYSKHGARLAGVAAHRITTRSLWWGTWGLLLGIATFGLVAWLGWLQFPWPQAQLPILITLGILYPVAGAGCWGHAGSWRGVSRFVITLGVDNGWVISLLSAMLDRMTAALRSSRRIDGLMDRGELWVGDLPLARWEELLKQASTAVIGETRPGSGRLMRWIRSLVVGQIEKIMLRIVRKEIEQGHGGGVSMVKVREVGLGMAEEAFQDGIVGLMNKQLLAMTGLFVLIAALPPLLAYILPLVLA